MHSKNTVQTLLSILSSNEQLPFLSLMWDLNGLGIRDSIIESEENDKIIQQFYATIKIAINDFMYSLEIQ